MTPTDFADQWSAMQKNLFLPAFSTALQENARRFWENEEKILSNMQTFANGWFERRHAGSRSAREAAEHMLASETMADAMQAYQEWMRGVFERIISDAVSCQQQMMAASDALASPPIAPSAHEKQAQAASSEQKVPARSKSA
jgi:hypothetical protein